MKLAFTDNFLWERFVPFVETLRSRGHEIILHSDKNIVPNADVWFVDFHQRADRNLHEKMVDELNKYEASYLAYSGKLIMYTLDDVGCAYLLGASEAIKKRIDAWVTFIRHPVGCDYRVTDMSYKFVLIPRYSIPYHKHVPHDKLNRVVFIGNLTGAYNYDNNTKNLRVECVRRIRNSHLNEHFLGGFVGTRLFDAPEHIQNSEYNDSFAAEAISPISGGEWQRWLDESLIYLHIRGNSKWSYRQPQAMQTHTAVITQRLPNDPAEWFMEDVFGDCFYYLHDDHSNLELIVDYALTNTKETIEKARNGFDIYNKYLSLNPNGTYQDYIWDKISAELEALGIHL